MIFWVPNLINERALMFDSTDFFELTNPLVSNIEKSNKNITSAACWENGVLFNRMFPDRNYIIRDPKMHGELQGVMNSVLQQKYPELKQNTFFSDSIVHHEKIFDFICFINIKYMNVSPIYYNYKVQKTIDNKRFDYYINISGVLKKSKYKRLIEKVFNVAIEQEPKNDIILHSLKIKTLHLKQHSKTSEFYIQIKTDDEIIDIDKQYLDRRPIELGSAIEEELDILRPGDPDYDLL